MNKTQDTAKLTDRELDDIEAQLDETAPIYIHTLIRELREARKLVRSLGEAARR